MEAVGCHVFAGGFTVGVQRVMDVRTHLEVHGFGLDTAREMCGVQTINCSAEQWPRMDGRGCLLYGNPRCTGFSCITSGYGADVHGQWSKPTRDIHELCKYGADNEFDVICWESVQQAYSKGKDLLAYLMREYLPRYRVAHLLLNAMSFGNSQCRKRYFFLAYRDGLRFNIEPPELESEHERTMYDAIYDRRDRVARAAKVWTGEYDEDSYTDLTKDEWACVPALPNGWCLNSLARYAYDELPPRYKHTWDTRGSDIPFSMHTIFRANWMRPSPTLHSSAGRIIHPDHHRPLTVGELSTIMGWPRIPVGRNPVAQIAKGIAPGAGEWLARQVRLCLSGHWGEDDWESSYDPSACEWRGRSTHGDREKVFDLTRYVGGRFDLERFPRAVWERHEHNVCRVTGRIIHPWRKSKSYA